MNKIMLSNLYIALKNLNVLRIYAYWTETELLQNQINLTGNSYHTDTIYNCTSFAASQR